ncbi:transcriptional regulator [Komagataeibacter rhaeticus DSM 16663]|nr:transcriptional regulator [Komagataeibacter rhaeticus DSM 16663]
MPSWRWSGWGRRKKVTTSPVLSRSTGIPEPTVAKVLKILATQGIVTSQRGARGGYRLAHPLEEISIAAVIEAIDGPISLTTCVDGGDCDARSTCGLGGEWDLVNTAIRNALSVIMLSDMKNHTVGDRLGGLRVPSAPGGPVATA